MVSRIAGNPVFQDTVISTK